MLPVRKRGKKEPPLRTVDEGLYWAVTGAELPGAGERGDKGSLPGMRGGERFYSQGRRASQVFPYKEESAGYSGRWCPRAPCWYLLGPGCRGSVPGSLASLWNLSVAFFWGIPQHARPFTSLSTYVIFFFFLFQASDGIYTGL